MGKYNDIAKGLLSKDTYLRCAEDVMTQIEELGFLPLFAGEINGLSIEEHTPRELWFADNVDGPWEWKGPIVRTGEYGYAKYFKNKAVFVSREWLPRLINVRREGKTLGYDEEKVLKAIEANESMLSTEIREECGFGRHGATAAERAFLANIDSDKVARSSLDSVLTKLQMKGMIVVADFEYDMGKNGKPYGWGKARYSTPEILYADWFKMPEESPEESRAAIIEHLQKLSPETDIKILKRIVG